MVLFVFLFVILENLSSLELALSGVKGLTAFVSLFTFSGGKLLKI